MFSRQLALQASFFYSREDRARFSGMDEALRSNLIRRPGRQVWTSKFLTGTEGLFTGTKLPNHNVTSVTSYANYRSELGYGRVDGTLRRVRWRSQDRHGRMKRTAMRRACSVAPTRATERR